MVVEVERLSETKTVCCASRYFWFDVLARKKNKNVCSNFSYVLFIIDIEEF